MENNLKKDRQLNVQYNIKLEDYTHNTYIERKPGKRAFLWYPLMLSLKKRAEMAVLMQVFTPNMQNLHKDQISQCGWLAYASFQKGPTVIYLYYLLQTD